MRLNKYLSEMGVCSRREADRLIAAGEVTVDGRPGEMGMQVDGTMEVVCHGVRVGGEPRPVLLAVNKPKGVVCTTTGHDRAPNIVELVGYPLRVYPIGRLDKESRGLVLLTNQGDLVNKVLRATLGHEREYVVRIDRMVTERMMETMRGGMELGREGASKMRRGTPPGDGGASETPGPDGEVGDGTVRTLPCKVTRAGSRSFRIVLTQGLNRQIRRMCRALGVGVRDLRRERIMNIRLGELAPGEYREIKGPELEMFLGELGSAKKS